MSTIHNIHGDMTAGTATLQAADEIAIWEASTGTPKKLTGAQVAGVVPGVVAVTAATLAVTQADHAGRVVTLDRAAGIDCTLPAATGSGATYTFYVVTTATDAYTFAAAGSDTICGSAFADDGDGEPANGWAATAATTVTLGGSSNATGGTKGAKIVFVDIAAALWHCSILDAQSGTEATPFS